MFGSGGSSRPQSNKKVYNYVKALFHTHTEATDLPGCLVHVVPFSLIPFACCLTLLEVFIC